MRLFVRRPFFLLLAVAALAAGSACNNNTASTTTTSTTTSPTAFTATETFTGTLTTNGAQSFPFTISAAGTVTLTLTSLTDTVNGAITPPSVGLSLGQWNGTSCAVQTGVFTDNAGPGASLSGTVPGAGTICARVYDSASLVTDPLAFTITVTHP